MQIIDLISNQAEHIEQAVALLRDSFACWSTYDSAREEVDESFGEGRISRIAVDEAGNVIGWIAGISQYSGRVWELHPLVVSQAHRMQGVGRMLVTDFEQQAAARGAITIVLGSDDEDGSTSFAGQNLYTEFPTQLANFEGNNHPTSFYMKLGYKIVGVIPDANGLGKPDITLAKRVR